MIKQLLFCEKENGVLKVSANILTDVFIPVQDVVSPQKTTLIVPKNDKIQLSNIIIIRDNNSAKIEYIGYIDTVTQKDTTEIACYPIINVFDNDFVLDQLYIETTNQDGTLANAPTDVVNWLAEQIEREFVETDDKLQAFPFIVRNKTNGAVLYKRIVDTANLLEVYTDIFIDTGVHVVFDEVRFNGNIIEGVYCDICCNTDIAPYTLRYNDPSIQEVDIVDNTFTNYNKLIATEEVPEDATLEQLANRQRYFFYLLNDNSITTDPDDERRIKQVRSKEITFSRENEEDTEEDVANALIQAVYKELQAPEYNLKITITMFNNENLKLYRRVDFYAESGIMYTSNITSLEQLNDKQVVVTLGALRNSLTDFKKKVEMI